MIPIEPACPTRTNASNFGVFMCQFKRMSDRFNSHGFAIEAPSRMEPLLLDQAPLILSDLAAGITQAVERLGSGFPPQTLASLADLVRLMNCYYSHLIEGHRTRPRDIERALRAGGTAATSKMLGDPTGERLLQLALAHVGTQRWIDSLHMGGTLPDPVNRTFVEEIHRRFYQNLPVEFLVICHPQTNAPRRQMTPGGFRNSGDEVDVGAHLPPSGGAAVDAFFNAFSERYARKNLSALGPAQRLWAIAAAHHRFLFLHPFDDGNGRVGRLLSHAMMLDAGLGACGLWSMSRGLARGIRSNAPHIPSFLSRFAGRPEPDQYKLMMSSTDQTRLGDLDGRGNLSRTRLREFCEWYLAIALDQIRFMTRHVRLDHLSESLVKHYVPRRRLDDRAGKILTAVTQLGTIERGAVRPLLGIQARLATKLIGELITDGIIASDSHKGSLRLQVGPEAAEILFPSLFSVEAMAEPP